MSDYSDIFSIDIKLTDTMYDSYKAIVSTNACRLSHMVNSSTVC